MPSWAGTALRRLHEGRGAPILLAALLLMAAALRWNNLDWDQGHVFHPDERHILMVTAGLALPFPLDWPLLLSPKSPLNPHSFAYGSLPFYLLKLTAHALASLGGLAEILAPLRAFGDFGQLRLIGRFLSGLFDVGSVALIYLVGCRLRDRRVGLLAAALLAFTVINVQYSHFYASDTLLTFFVLAATLFSVDVLQTGRLKAAVWAGIAIGLAVGSKFSAMPVLAVLGSAHLLRLFTAEATATGRGGLRLRMPSAAELDRGVLGLAVSLLVAAAVFVIVEPYAVIDFGTFTKHLSEQNDMVRGVADLPYTRQYANTPAYWYPTWNLLIWGMGLPLGLVVLAGALGVVAKALRRPRQSELLLLAWVVPYFAITGSFHAKFLRYLLPLTPFLCLLAAYGLYSLRDWLEARRRAIVGDGIGHGDVFRHGDTEGTESAKGYRVGPYAESSAVAAQPDENKGGQLPAPREGATTVAQAAGEEDEEARRWAELKGLSLFEDDGEDRERGEPAAEGMRAAAALRSLPLSRPALGEGVSWPAQLVAWGWAERAVSVAMAVAIVGGVLYALAFANIYGAEHTAVRASKWIYQNVPEGARLMTEHWEEGMPVSVVIDGSTYDAGRMGYKMLAFEGYQPDNPAKFRHIVERLSEAEYIVFFSNRLYGTIPRLPQRYPITSRYYELLFGEQLGFRLEAYFTAYPSVLGVTLVEDTFGDPRLPVPAALAAFRPTPLTIVPGKADESFSVYDHPKVLIFKKQKSLTEEQLRALFGPALGQPAQEPGRPVIVPGVAKPLLLSEAQRAAIAAGGTFRDLFDRDDIANRLPIVVWVVLVELLGLLGLPLALTVFRHLPDRGYLLAKPLSILALAWLDWMLVSSGLLQSTRGTAALALLLLTVGSAYFALRQRSALRAAWRERRGQIVIGEVVFWTAFGLFLAIRLANPDLWHPARGGEKPMDLAYLMAAIKSATFPPYDPWFAGGYLNYYYYGQIIVATLIKLSGIVPTTAYNLVVPLLFALTAGGAFSAAYNLVAGRAGVFAGVGGALAAVVLGNLGGAVQLIDQIMRLGPPPLRSSLPGVEGLSAFFAGLWRLLVESRGLDIPPDWYWASTRVLQGTINEFPFFTFLYADLHAHMIALPFTLLALGLAIEVVKGYRGAGERAGIEHVATVGGVPAGGAGLKPAPPAGGRISPEGLLRALVIGLAIGALMPINSWDFPTYLALYGVALLVGWYLARPLSLRGLGVVALKAVGVVVLSYALYWPFHSNFQQWYTGVDQIKDKSDVWGYLRIHGLFLFAIVSFLASETGRRYGHTGLPRMAGFWLRHWDRLPRAIALQRRLVKRGDPGAWLACYGIGALLALLLVVHWLGMTLVAMLLGLLVWTGLLVLHQGRGETGATTPGRPYRDGGEHAFGDERGREHGDDRSERTFTLALVAMGLALSAVVEIVALKGDIGRMNTVFKFYLQVWILWSVAAAAGLYFAWQEIRVRWSHGHREIWAAALALLVTAALVYPLIATRARVSDRFNNAIAPTLDGTAYMASAVFREQNPETKQEREVRLGSDLPAMRWLQDNVAGTPVILEGWAPLYHWGARYSIYTGLPTVIGWDWHQKQQRWGYQTEIDQRLADVRTIYSDPSVERAASLLAKYRVQYVIVGDLERAVYTAAGLAKFDRMVGEYFEVVYNEQGVKIYRRL